MQKQQRQNLETGKCNRLIPYILRRQSGRQKWRRIFSAPGLPREFRGRKRARLRSHQNSATMSGGLKKAEYKRLIHFVLHNRILNDATYIRLWYAPSWSRLWYCAPRSGNFLYVFFYNRWVLLSTTAHAQRQPKQSLEVFDAMPFKDKITHQNDGKDEFCAAHMDSLVYFYCQE